MGKRLTKKQKIEMRLPAAEAMLRYIRYRASEANALIMDCPSAEYIAGWMYEGLTGNYKMEKVQPGHPLFREGVSVYVWKCECGPGLGAGYQWDNNKSWDTLPYFYAIEQDYPGFIGPKIVD